MKVAPNFFKEVELYAHDKGMTAKGLIEIIESSIAEGLSDHYSTGQIKVSISKLDNTVSAVEITEVVENVKNPRKEIHLEEIIDEYPQAKIGSILEKECHFPDMERVVVKKIRDFFSRNLNFLEREMQYEALKDKVGTVSSYIVKGMEFGNLIVDTGSGDGLIHKDDLIPGELLNIHDRIRAMIYQVSRKDKGFQVLLTRTSNDFLMYLIKDVIPEVADGSIEIKAIARVPGRRSKVAVVGIDPRIDPVGTCVGIKGVRVNSIVKELNGEKIDIVPWSQDEAAFILSAIAPAEVSKIVIDGYNVTIVVPESQLSLAIGSGGLNIKLASKMTKRGIKVMSETDYNKIKSDEVNVAVDKFVKALSVDEIMARFLVSQGFVKFNDILTTSLESLAAIDGLDSEIAQELQNRAENYLSQQFKTASEDLVDFMEDKDLLLEIFQKTDKIQNLKDLADLSSEEIIEIVSNSEFTKEKAGDIIIKARARLGWLND